jgi:tRNA dimethylallyltransferase
VDDIVARGKTAIIAGGTGLYMDSLIKGNEFAPFPSTGMREKLERQADEEGMEAMRLLLRAIDPEAEARIQDRKRLLRALEVYYETGETITEHNRKTQQIPPKYTPVWLGLDFEDRQTLYDRIDLRVEIMLRQGLVEEIRSLLDSGIPAKCTAMQAIGYKEFVDALAGQGTIAEAAAQVQQSSRRYAKRQLTWLRRNPAMHWLTRGKTEGFDEILQKARQALQETDN